MRCITLTFDDSSFFVARSFAALANSDRVTCSNMLISDGRNDQFVELHRDAPFFDGLVSERELFSREFLQRYDVLFAAKLKRSFAALWSSELNAARPFILVAYPGVELTPASGFANRVNCDGLIFNTRSDLEVYRLAHPEAAQRQHLWVGNPILLYRARSHYALEVAHDQSQDIFFAQSITPATRSQRKAVLRLLQSRGGTTVKLRQEAGLAQEHVHRERYSYRALAGDPPIVPIAYMSMDWVLDHYKGFISCSSTAVLEAVAVGHDAAFVRDFPGWHSDPLHVANLAYATRYGLAISSADLSRGHPLPKRPNPRFFLDFGLDVAEPDWLQALPQLRPPRNPGAAGNVVSLRSASPPSSPEVLRLYSSANNPHKAFFTGLAHCLKHPEDLEDCREWLSQLNRPDHWLLGERDFKRILAIANRRSILKRARRLGFSSRRTKN